MVNYKFLTTKPLARQMYKEQQEFLYVLALANMGASVITFSLFYTNDTSGLMTKSIGSPSKGEIIVLDIGFDAIDYNSLHPERTIEYIKVDGGDVEERLVITPVVLGTDTVRHIHYFNSMGGMDSLICTGSKMESQEIDYELSQQSRPADAANSFAEYLTHDTKSSDVMTVNTGYKPLKEIKAVKDLFTVNRAYEIDSLYGTKDWVPLIVTKKKISYDPEDSNLQKITFTARPANDELAQDRVL